MRLVKILHGSHLYGLNTPESDRDYKGVFMPGLDELFLKGPDSHIRHTTKIGDGKNTKDDVDDVWFSLVFFANLAARGEMIAMDMLYAPREFQLERSPYWDLIQENRDLFVSKSMRAYVGYIKKQVSKYGQKGSRIDALQRAIAWLSNFKESDRLGDAMLAIPPPEVEDMLAVGECDAPNGGMMACYEVLGSKFGATTRIRHILEPLVKREKEYGRRARLAQNNENIDWKAVSHAFRACIQLHHLYTHGKMILPLPKECVDIIMPVKMGLVPWAEASETLDNMVHDVMRLAEQSKFPEAVDRSKIDELVLQISHEVYFYPSMRENPIPLGVGMNRINFLDFQYIV